MHTRVAVLLVLALLASGAWWALGRGGADPARPGGLERSGGALDPRRAPAGEEVAAAGAAERSTIDRSEADADDAEEAAGARERTRARIANLGRRTPPGADPPPPDPGTLSVRVLDGGGEPVPRARVLAAEVARELRPPGGPIASAEDVRHASSAMAGDDGVARLAGLRPGAWRPWAGKHLWHYHPGPVVEVDGAFAPREVVIHIQPLSAHQLLSGRVVDPAGAPVARAHLDFHWREGERLERRSTVSAADGRFALGLGWPEVRGALLASHGILGSVVVDGVGPGDGELEVRLRARRELVLDPRGRDGEPLERFDARFERQILGLWAAEPRPERRRPDEPLYWHLPDVPFRVNVRADGYGSQTFGPFEPESIGRTLRVDLEPLEVARGRVSLAGEPVAGAVVCFELPLAGFVGDALDLELARRPTSPMLRASRQVRSDAQGRFELPLEPGLIGTFDLVARSAPYLEARVAGIAVDARSALGDFELALAALRGAIRGVVLTPPDISPRSVWVQLSRPGESFHTGVDGHGRFGVDSLGAGRWRLAVHDRGSAAAADDSDVGARLVYSHGPGEEAPAWCLHDTSRFVDLVPGEAVEVELDLTRAPACRLEGAFLLDGRPLAPMRDGIDGYFRFSGRRAYLELEGELGPSSRSYLGPDGTFLLGVEQPGAYRLRLELPLDIGTTLVVLDRVELRSGTVSWSLDLATARLAVQPGSSLGPDSFALVHRWRGPGELRVVSQFPVRDSERRQLVFPQVPSGPGTLLLDPVRAAPTVLTDVDVAPGGETLIDLP